MDVVERIAQVLGGLAVLQSSVRTWVDLDRIVRAGLPKRSLQLVARRAVEPGASINAFVYRVVPSATFKRRSRLSVDESERTERLARAVALAEALWVTNRRRGHSSIVLIRCSTARHRWMSRAPSWAHDASNGCFTMSSTGSRSNRKGPSNQNSEFRMRNSRDTRSWTPIG